MLKVPDETDYKAILYRLDQIERDIDWLSRSYVLLARAVDDIHKRVGIKKTSEQIMADVRNAVEELKEKGTYR